jgi:DNA-binding transcriptional LysR family regulator
LKLHQLRDVIAVADQGSLRAAARHLNIAQSAITKSVRQLEKELDVSLFERHKRGAVLTPMGTLFLQRARSAAGELERAQEEISQHRGAGVGRVTVSLSTVPHMALLPSVIRVFTQRYPEIKLTVLESLGFHSIEAQMRAGGIDAYIGVAPESKISTEYQVEPLFANRRYVVGRSGNSHSGAGSLHDLVDAHWIVSSTATANSSFAAMFKRYHAKLPARITFAGSILSQLIFLLNSDMLMVAPRQVVEFAPYVGRIVRIPIKEELDAPMMVMIMRTALPLTPAAEHFCDLIRRAAVQQGGAEVPRTAD